MAPQIKNTSFFLFIKVALVLTLVLMVSIAAESKIVGNGFGEQDSSPACNSVHGTGSDETCTSVATDFNLSFEDFLAINPNVNCDSIFVGQWLCVDGSA